MRYVMVKLTRSEAAERVSEFRPWEVPILRLIHGNELVSVVGEVDYPKVPYPDAHDEYARLETRYRGAEGSDASYCRQVYGIGAVQLGQAIKAAEVEAASRDAIAFVPTQGIDLSSKGYLKAEADAIARDREAVRQERAQAAREAAEKAEADAKVLADERATLEAGKAKLAADQAALAKEQAAVAELLDAATADTSAKPARSGKGAATPAKPISE